MADILIRGMEMPKERSLWLCIKTDGTVYNIKPGGIGTAHAVGTAVHLPEGHGRLIDADALFEVMGQDTERWLIDDISYIETDDAISAVYKAPTIVPAEGGTDDGT